MHFRNIRIGNYQVKISPHENDLARLFYFWNLTIPYFWDSPISFDMIIAPIKRDIRKPYKSWEYKWELYELDENIVIKHGDGEYSFEHINVIGMNKRKHISNKDRVS